MEYETRCASCGAHLQYQTDTPEKCTYCGSRVPLKSKGISTQVNPWQPASIAGGKTVLYAVVGLIIFVVVSTGMSVYFLVGTVDDVITETIPNISIPEALNKADEVPAFAEEVLRFGGEGNGVGKFEDNRSVAVDGNMQVYTTDYAGGRVQVFDENGKFVKQWMNDLQYVSDMCVSRDGILYMISGSKITSFDGSSGEKLKESDREFFRNMTMAADGYIMATTTNGDLFKLDKNLNTVTVSKNLMTKAGMPNNITNGIACNGLGEFFVLDFIGQHVYHFSAKMEFLDKFKTKTSSANGIVVSPQGQVFISAMNEIYVYDAEGEYVNSFPARQAFGMTFDDNGGLWVAARPYVLKYKIKAD